LGLPFIKKMRADILIYLIFGYLVGSFTFAQILSLIFFKTDLRKRGTGYTGASNLVALAGWKWGIIAGILDISKTFLVLILTYKFTNSEFYSLLSGIMTALGHIYPIYFGFKGGKGGACATAILFFISPKVFFLSSIFGIIVLILTRIPVTLYILTAFLYPTLLFLFHFKPQMIISVLALFAILLFEMKENIISFIKGKEIRIGEGEIGGKKKENLRQN